MRVLALGVSFGLIFSTGLFGCGESKPKNSNKDAAGGDTAPDAPAMCKGTFAMHTRATLGAQSSSTGKCISAADLNVICDNDVGTRVRMVGGNCFAANPLGGAEALASCTLMELMKDTTPDPSTECYGCYLAATGCTLANCRTECLADSTAQVCITCQAAKGCLTAFYQCSGLPPPAGIVLPDGGTDASTDGRDAATEGGSDTTTDGGTDTASEGGSDTPAEGGSEGGSEGGAADAADETSAG